MQFLIKLLLSLEKLLKNPIQWFDGQIWIVRMILVLSLVPLISVVSIFSYQKLSLDALTGSGLSLDTAQSITKLNEEIARQHETEIEELILLRENIATLNKLLMVTSKIDVENDDTNLVLGVQDSEQITNNLRQRLQDYIDNKYLITSEIDSDLTLAYVKIAENSAAFLEPSINSAKIEDFEQGVFYPALDEKGDWQQIELADGQKAWIEKQYIMLFPVHENN
jgi:hypothetical protein